MKQYNNATMKDGFTLTEFLVVIGIIMILASVTILTFASLYPGLRLKGAVRGLVTDLRYTQQLAVAEQLDHGIRFSTTTKDRYQIIKHEDATSTLIREEVLPEGINFQYVSSLTNDEVRFNPYGAAEEAATTTLVNTKGETKTIKVGPSGFVKIKD